MSSKSLFPLPLRMSDTSITWNAYLAKGVPPSKRVFVGGNWKCNGTIKDVNALISALNLMTIPLTSEVVLAVPSIYLSLAKAQFRAEVAVSSQDASFFGNGAYTGETSAPMLADMGVRWTLVGHSERRIGFGFPGETSEVCAAKTKRALDAGVSVIFCIGESLAERESGKTLDVCAAQLKPLLALNLDSAVWRKSIVIAYEPVWAIGTGKVATPQQAEQTHLEIRQHLNNCALGAASKDVRIIYGGSVKGSNCKELIGGPNIDGFLVGGASLLPEFQDIIKCSV